MFITARQTTALCLHREGRLCLPQRAVRPSPTVRLPLLQGTGPFHQPGPSARQSGQGGRCGGDQPTRLEKLPVPEHHQTGRHPAQPHTEAVPGDQHLMATAERRRRGRLVDCGGPPSPACGRVWWTLWRGGLSCGRCFMDAIVCSPRWKQSCGGRFAVTVAGTPRCDCAEDEGRGDSVRRHRVAID